MPDTLRLAPDVPDLAALGARGIEDFLGDCKALATGARASGPVRSGARTSVRVPLPGTPDASGRRLELPRGAGTGWLAVHTWSSGPLDLVRERLRAPHSSSPAARRWNLACHLLGCGVGAPRPLALLERACGARVESVLVEAELEGLQPLPRWIASTPPGSERSRGLHALALGLAALLRSGAWLGACTSEDILIGSGAASCAEQLADLARWRARAIVQAGLPAVGFAGLEGGVLRASLGARRRLAWLSGLESSLPDTARLTDRERVRLGLAVLAGLDGGRSALRQTCSARATAAARTAS
jgi:Lipopolysaccharide kinase (Kdo/WaaP) family